MPLAQTLENLNDESLMELIQENDHRAFSILVERRAEMFYAAAYRMVINKQDAEDIVQEAFLKIWNKPLMWKKDKKAKFTTWFYKIVMNMCVDKLRKLANENKAAVDLDIVSGDLNQEMEMVCDEEQKLLNEAIKKLPENQLMAINLCFYEELTNKEAADVMGVNVKALESLLMRAKSKLKDILYREGILEQGDVA